MENNDSNYNNYIQRIASLEAKLEFLKELLTEIRNDIKEHPTRQEIEDIENRVDKLENRMTDHEQKQTPFLIKIGIIFGLLGFFTSYLLRYFLTS